MATTTEKLILELQARIEKYNRDILDATKKTEQFQKKTAKAFTAIEKDAKRVDKSLSNFTKSVKKSFGNVNKSVTKSTTAFKTFSTKSKKSLTSVRKDSAKTVKSINKLGTSIKKLPKKLSIKIDLKDKKIRDAINSLGKLDKRVKQTSGSLFRFSNVAKGVFAAIGTRAFVTFADDITRADNQLRNVTANAEQFNFVQMELNRIAQETRQDVNSLTSVFARFTRAGQQAGFSQQELLGFTEDLTKAFKLEGNTTAEVNSTLLQLTQSFRKGIIDGEEFRALSENSTLALQALSKQLKVNIGDLKDLGAQGKLAPRDLIEGLRGIRDQINTEFATLEPTFGELGTKIGNLLAKGFRESDAKTFLDNFKKDISATIDSIDFAFSDTGRKLILQSRLITRIGVDAVNRIIEKSEEIAELKSKITITTDIQEIDELAVKIKSLKLNIEDISSTGLIIGFDVGTKEIEAINNEINELIKSRQTLIDNNKIEFEGVDQARRQIEELKKSILGEVPDDSLFDKFFNKGLDTTIELLSRFIIEAKEAKAVIAPEDADIEEKRKPIVTFGAAEDKIITQGARRLTLIEDQAEAERQLLQAVDENKISDAEASAILANQKETDRLNEQFTRTLERLETNQTAIDELKALASEIGLEKLTEDEQALIDLAQRAADAKIAITEKQEAKLAKIRDIARRNELSSNISAGGKLLGAISGLAKKGTAIQETAAKASIIASTAAGMMRQYKDLPFPAAVLTKTAVFLEGVAALGAIGGGDSGGLSGAAAAAATVEEEITGEEATPTLDVSVTEISDEGTAGSRLIIDASAGTSSDQFLADAWNDGVRSGRITGRNV